MKFGFEPIRLNLACISFSEVSQFFFYIYHQIGTKSFKRLLKSFIDITHSLGFCVSSKKVSCPVERSLSVHTHAIPGLLLTGRVTGFFFTKFQFFMSRNITFFTSRNFTFLCVTYFYMFFRHKTFPLRAVLVMNSTPYAT